MAPTPAECHNQRDGNSSDRGKHHVVFADYGIANPSNGAVTTQDHGLIEFLLVATARAVCGTRRQSATATGDC